MEAYLNNNLEVFEWLVDYAVKISVQYESIIIQLLANRPKTIKSF